MNGKNKEGDEFYQALSIMTSNVNSLSKQIKQMVRMNIKSKTLLFSTPNNSFRIQKLQ